MRTKDSKPYIRSAPNISSVVVKINRLKGPTNGQQEAQVVVVCAGGGGGIVLPDDLELAEHAGGEGGSDAGVGIEVEVAPVVERWKVLEVVEHRDLVVELLIDVVGQAQGDAIVGAVVGIVFVDVADASLGGEVEIGGLDPLIADADAGREAVVEEGQAVVVVAHQGVAVELVGEELVVLGLGEPVVGAGGLDAV